VLASVARLRNYYGFIACADGPDTFVDYVGIDGYGFRTLEEGHRVEFEETPGPWSPQTPVSARYERGTR
jgi:cold shock CspA family protein